MGVPQKVPVSHVTLIRKHDYQQMATPGRRNWKRSRVTAASHGLHQLSLLQQPQVADQEETPSPCRATVALHCLPRTAGRKRAGEGRPESSWRRNSSGVQVRKRRGATPRPGQWRIGLPINPFTTKTRGFRWCQLTGVSTTNGNRWPQVVNASPSWILQVSYNMSFACLKSCLGVCWYNVHSSTWHWKDARKVISY